MMSLDSRIIHYRLLSHAGLGTTELRVFAPGPRVGYVDNEADFVRLCRIAEPHVPGIYVGVQSRPLHLFDLANAALVAREACKNLRLRQENRKNNITNPNKKEV